MHELLSYLAHKGVATLLTLAQHGFVGTNISAPVDVSYLADSVLLFRYLSGRRGTEALAEIKKRSGEHERTIRELVMKHGTIRVGEALRNLMAFDRRSQISRQTLRTGGSFYKNRNPQHAGDV